MRLLTGLLLASIISVSHSALAQRKFLMGVKLGVNVATQEVKGSYPAAVGSVTRVHVGIITEQKFGKLGFQAEAMYSGHGCSYNGIIRKNLKSRFDYINVPLFAKWYITDNIAVVGGPQFGMIFDQEFQDDRTGVVRRDDFSTKYSRFETSVGGGLEFQLNNGIGCYGRYIYGITKIDEDLPFLTFTKNKTIQFGLSYRF